ncbi:unnamed protein product, partial [Trichobilharzia regenti]
MSLHSPMSDDISTGPSRNHMDGEVGGQTNSAFPSLSTQTPRPYPVIKRDEDEDLAQAEIYANYIPLKLKFGRKHSNPVVESSPLSSVSPPDIHYRLCLPDEVIDHACLSALQLEAVVYAYQRHECILPNGQRAGFLIGDGAVVGKGRTMNIIYDIVKSPFGYQFPMITKLMPNVIYMTLNMHVSLVKLMDVLRKLAKVKAVQRLPNARIVYASATGAIEPRNMAYMTRLGLWGEGTPFKTFNSFIQTLERRGVGTMELVAMDMKLHGMYIARQLSFHGVHFGIQENDSFIHVYNQSTDLWVYAYRFFTEASRLLNLNDRYRKTMWGQFWSAHQRFFKYFCIAAKVDTCVEFAKNAIKEGEYVVISLPSTGEAKTLQQVEEYGSDLGEFVSIAKVGKYFPTPTQIDFEGGSGGANKPEDKGSYSNDNDDEHSEESEDDDDDSDFNNGVEVNGGVNPLGGNPHL